MTAKTLCGCHRDWEEDWGLGVALARVVAREGREREGRMGKCRQAWNAKERKNREQGTGNREDRTEGQVRTR